MTVQITIPVFSQALRHSLVALCNGERASIRTAQFCAAAATRTSHAAYRELWQSLREAPRRGADCRMLLAQPTPRNPQSAESAAAAMDLALLGWRVRWIKPGALAHMKLWIFGDDLVIMGSHNLTQSAMISNHEASIITRDHAAVADTAAWYEAQWRVATQRPTIGLA